MTLTREDFFDEDNQPMISKIKEQFIGQKPLPFEAAKEILSRAVELFKQDQNVIKLKAPILIAGDIHGQFYDLLYIFEKYSEVLKARYLFLGDYVDRGNFSTECFLYLLALKIKYPNNLFMLRGNHETRIQSSTFTYKIEAQMKYNMEIFNLSINVFDSLPLAAIVGDKLFCVHGGLSPNLRSINDIMSINRFHEPVKNSMMHDLIWSDPLPNYDNDVNISFQPNTYRNCSYFYTYSDVVRFLNHNHLQSLVRAHSVFVEGYHLYKKMPQNALPSVFSIFSAPNYCSSIKNKGGILFFDGTNASIVQYQGVNEPEVLNPIPISKSDFPEENVIE